MLQHICCQSVSSTEMVTFFLILQIFKYFSIEFFSNCIINSIHLFFHIELKLTYFLSVKQSGLVFSESEWQEEWSNILRLASTRPRGCPDPMRSNNCCDSVVTEGYSTILFFLRRFVKSIYSKYLILALASRD